MEISVSLPLDDGFLRRQCSNCGRQFKWHHGPTDDRPSDFADPPMYYCPYCGEPAGVDDWLTDEQVEYVQAMAAGPAMREISEEFERMARRHSSGLVKMSVKSTGEPELPDPLVEPSDMVAVASPCHPWEPVKVSEDWQEPLRCLVCGASYSIG